MKTRKQDTHRMVGIALMAAIIVLLANTPLGMIPLPMIRATTVHIPVILGAILFGPLAGTILGAVFGICSMVIATTAPTPMSFAFSPFLSTTGLPGALKAIWISVGCRMMIGLASGWLWIGFKKLFKNPKTRDLVGLPVVGFAGAMVNTIMVMGSIYFLLAKQYAEVQDVAMEAVSGLVMATVTGVGVMEALVSLVLVALIGKVLLHFLPKTGIIKG